VTRVKVEPPKATIELSPGELVIIVNALNEVCNGLDLPDFSTRIGADRQAAERLLAEMRSLADPTVKTS
jgi:hypothetical protein